MPGKAILKETIKRNTIHEMKTLGIYRKEYDTIIDIYAEMREQYERLTKEFKDSGYTEYSTSTGAGGDKKSPLIGTLEGLRKDILNYSDRLGLNPKSLESLTENKQSSESSLVKALRGIS